MQWYQAWMWLRKAQAIFADETVVQSNQPRTSVAHTLIIMQVV